jgi:hypothetical protein
MQRDSRKKKGIIWGGRKKDKTQNRQNENTKRKYGENKRY